MINKNTMLDYKCYRIQKDSSDVQIGNKMMNAGDCEKQRNKSVWIKPFRLALLLVALVISGASYASAYVTMGPSFTGLAAQAQMGCLPTEVSPLMMTDGDAPTITITPNYADETLTLSLSTNEEGFVFYYTTDGTTTPSVTGAVEDNEVAVTLGDNTSEATGNVISVSSLENGATVKVIAVKMTVSGSDVATVSSAVAQQVVSRYAVPTVSANYTSLTNHQFTITDPNTTDATTTVHYAVGRNAVPAATDGTVSGTSLDVEYYNTKYNFRVFGENMFPSATVTLGTDRYDIPAILDYVSYAAPTTSQVQVNASGTVACLGATIYINTSATTNDTLAVPDPSNTNTYTHAWSHGTAIPSNFTDLVFKMVAGPEVGATDVTKFPSAMVLVDTTYTGAYVIQNTDGTTHHYLSLDSNSHMLRNVDTYDYSCLWYLDGQHHLYQIIGATRYYLDYSQTTLSVSSSGTHGTWHLHPLSHTLYSSNNYALVYEGDAWHLSPNGADPGVLYAVGRVHSPSGSVRRITSFTLDSITYAGSKPTWISMANGDEACSLSVKPNVAVTTYILPSHDHYYYEDAEGNDCNFAFYSFFNRSYSDHIDLPFQTVPTDGVNYTVDADNIAYDWQIQLDDNSSLSLGSASTASTGVSGNTLSRVGAVTSPTRAVVTVSATYQISDEQSDYLSSSQTASAESTPLVVYLEQKASGLKAIDESGTVSDISTDGVYLLANYAEGDTDYNERHYLSVDSEGNAVLTTDANAERVVSLSHTTQGYNLSVYASATGQQLGQNTTSGAYNPDVSAVTFLSSGTGDEASRRFTLTPYQDGDNTYFTVHPKDITDSVSLVPEHGANTEGATLRLVGSKSGSHTYQSSSMSTAVDYLFDTNYFYTSRWQLVVPSSLPPVVHMSPSGVISITDSLSQLSGLEGSFYYQTRSAGGEWSAEQTFDSANPCTLSLGDTLRAKKAFSGTLSHASDYTYFVARKVENPTLTAAGNNISLTALLATDNTQLNTTIKYTLDGTDPGEAQSGITYSAPADTITHACTLGYRAYAADCYMSDFAQYTHQAVLPLQIEVSEDGNTATLVISDENIDPTNYVIYYTTDGTNPSYNTNSGSVISNGTLYTAGTSIDLTNLFALRAQAYSLSNNYIESAIESYYYNPFFLVFTHVLNDHAENHTPEASDFNMMLINAQNHNSVENQNYINTSVFWLVSADARTNGSLVYNSLTATYLTCDADGTLFVTPDASAAQHWYWGGEPNYPTSATTTGDYRLYTTMGSDPATTYYLAFNTQSLTWQLTNSTEADGLELSVAYRCDTIQYPGGDEFSPRGKNLELEYPYGSDQWVALDTASTAWLAMSQSEQLRLRASIKGIGIHYEANIDINIHKDEYDDTDHEEDDYDHYLPWQQWHLKDGVYCHYYYEVEGYRDSAVDNHSDFRCTWRLSDSDTLIAGSSRTEGYFTYLVAEDGTSITLTRTNTAPNAPLFDNSLTVRYQHFDTYASNGESFDEDVTVHLYAENAITGVSSDNLNVHKRFKNCYSNKYLSVDTTQQVQNLTAYPYLNGENIIGPLAAYTRYAVWNLQVVTNGLTMVNMSFPNYKVYRRPDDVGGVYMLNPNSEAMYNYMHQSSTPADPTTGSNSTYVSFSTKKFQNGSSYYTAGMTHNSADGLALDSNNTWQYLAYGSGHVATTGAPEFWSRRWKLEDAQLPPPEIYMDPSGALTFTHLMLGSNNLTIYYTLDGTTPTTSSTVWTSESSVTLTLNQTVKAIAVLTQDENGYTASTSEAATFTVSQTPAVTLDGTTLAATEGDSIVVGINKAIGSVLWNSNGEGFLHYGQQVTESEYNNYFGNGDVLTVIAYRQNQLASEPYYYSEQQQLSLAVENVTIDDGNNTATVTFHVNGTSANNLPPQSAYYKVYYTIDKSEPTTSSSYVQAANNDYHATATINITGLTLLKAKAIPVSDITFYTESDVVEQYLVPSNYTQTLSGTGTLSDPYQISSALDLVSVANVDTNWASGKHFKVMNDIDLTGISVPSIGSSTNQFQGKWNGNYKIITHATNPLFAVCSNAHVYNVVIANSAIATTSGHCGAICSVTEGITRIYNCGVRGETTVTGAGYTGGIVGHLNGNSRVVNCYNFAEVSSTGNHAGGIVGYQETSSTTGNNGLHGLIFNSINYGNVTASNGTAYPVAGGNTTVHSTNSSGFSTYTYFLLDVDNENYNNANNSLAAEERFLTRFEFYRGILNSNLKKCGRWINRYDDGRTGDVAVGTAFTDTIAADLTNMGAWAIDKSIAPYPIVLPKYETVNGVRRAKVYPSVVNPDFANASENALPYQGKKLGTLRVTMNGGAKRSTESDSTTLNITDMDTTNYDYSYYKVQLPYFQDYFGVGSNIVTVSSQDYIVTGWEITSVVGGTTGSYSADTTSAVYYNFADRACTNKDLYSVSGRVFAQGGYYYVPNGVTAITITAHWGRAVYLAEYANESGYKNGNTVQEQSGLYGTFAKKAYGSTKTTYTSWSDAMGQLTSSTSRSSVYDQAIVLLTDYHGIDGSGKFDYSSDRQRPFTIMSIDEDNDHEPDHLIYVTYLSRVPTNPVRFDMLVSAPYNYCALPGTRRPTASPMYLVNGHFEITETALAYFTEFEYDNRGGNNSNKAYSPLILNGGVFEQIVSGENTGAHSDRTTYIHLGGHVWFKKFTPGAHGNDATKTRRTRHCPITVTGGEYQKFYLSGIFRPNVTAYGNATDRPRLYADGGKFGEYASGGNDKIGGDVTVVANHIIADEFYGGGIYPDNPIGGDISITLDNSIVGLYAAGPKAGDMPSGKTVTTRATNTIFGTYYGAGYGGTGFTFYFKEGWAYTYPNQKTFQTDLIPYYNGKRGKVFRDRSIDYGIVTDYSLDFMPTANDTSRLLSRIYLYGAKLSKATTNDVTSTLNGCTVLNDFYGAGYVGKVEGTATSTLNNCTVKGNVFAGGMSGVAPKAVIYPSIDLDKIPQVISSVYYVPEKPEPEVYTWTYKSDLGTNDKTQGIDETKKLIYTTVDMSDIGQATNTVLNITGNTVVEGSVFGGGNLAEVSNDIELNIGTNATNATAETLAASRPYIQENVYGGGNVADVGTVTNSDTSSVVVNIYNGFMKSVYGGGNQGSVLGNTTVNLKGGFVGYTPGTTTENDVAEIDYSKRDSIRPSVGADGLFFGVYGGGFGLGTTVQGRSTVNVGAASDMTDEVAVFGSVFGGGEMGQMGGGYKLEHVDEGETLSNNYYYYDSDVSAYVRCTASYIAQAGVDYYTFVQPKFDSNSTRVTVLSDSAKHTYIRGVVYGGGRGYYLSYAKDGTVSGLEVTNSLPIAGAVYGNTHVNIGTVGQDTTWLDIDALRVMSEAQSAIEFGLVDNDEETSSAMIYGSKTLYVYDVDKLDYVPITPGESEAVSARVLTTTKDPSDAKTINICSETLDSEVQYYHSAERVSVVGGGENGAVYGSGIFGENNILNASTPRYGSTGGNCYVTISSGDLGNVDSTIGDVQGDVFAGGLMGTIDGVAQIKVNGSTVRVRGDVYGGGSLSTSYAYNRPNEDTEIDVARVEVTGGWVRNVFGGSNMVVLPKNGRTRVILGTPNSTNHDTLLVSESVYGGSGLSGTYGSTDVTVYSGRVGFVKAGYSINSTDEADNVTTDNPVGTIICNSDNALSYEGNVYGSGFGPMAFVKNTSVKVHGGIIRNGVLGGGELAPVGDISSDGDGTYEYHIYNSNGVDNATVTKYNIQKDGTGNEIPVTNIEIYGGTMSAVCGGGRGYTNFLNVGSTTPGTILGSTRVYIAGGEINDDNYSEALGGATVYGGGLEGEVVGNTDVRIVGGTIGARAFAGGRGYHNSMLHDDEDNPTNGDIFTCASRRAGAVIGNTRILVKDSTDQIKPTVGYGVYGGGEGLNYVTNYAGRTLRDTVAVVYGNATVDLQGGTLGGGHNKGMTDNCGSYAGGRVAPVHGYADMLVSGTTDVAAVYGGNDISGSVIGFGRNTTNSRGNTLTRDSTSTYLLITGTPQVGHAFGGGNGQYPYYSDIAYSYLNVSQPRQPSTYVDIATTGGLVNQVFGGGNSAKVDTSRVFYYGSGLVDTLFAGGNSATVVASANVVVRANTVGESSNSSTPVGDMDYDNQSSANHINYLFGGNNRATMYILPTLDLTMGTMGKVYGGGNLGAMYGNDTRTDFYGRTVSNLSTYVLVNSDAATITEALFGGCNRAQVKYGAYVDVRTTSSESVGGVNRLFGGNDVSEEVGFSRIDMNGGYVSQLFGGGNGNYNYTRSGNLYGVTSKDDNSPVADNVTGRPVVDSTNVNIWGGIINSSIYGGGYAGDCRITNVVVNDTFMNNTTSAATINGTIFGGGFGDVSLLGTSTAHVGNVTSIARTNLYHVTTLNNAKAYGGGEAGDVQDAEMNVYPDWNQTLDALYGGCYGSDVTGTATVNLYCKSPASGNNIEDLFGGNDYSGTANATIVNVYDGTYGRVFGAGNGAYNYSGNISRPNSMYPTINFYNGTVKGNLYGGGNEGLCFVGDTTASHTVVDDYAHVVVNIHGGEFENDIYAGAAGNELNPTQLIYGLKQLNMDGCHVANSVYGGSESVRDGYPNECSATNTTTLRPSTILNITGGEVVNNVYGGGYLGKVYGSVFVNVGQEAVNDSPVWTKTVNGTANAYSAYKPEFVTDSASAVGSKLMKRNLFLESSIYNGANWGDAGTAAFFSSEGFIGGESRIRVDGEGYNTSLSTTGTSLPAMDIHYSLIGAGTSCKGGDVYSRIVVRNYGDHSTCTTSKELYSIQRATRVELENTAIKYIGDQDAYSAYPSVRYSFNRMDTLQLKGYNVLEIDEPMDNVGNLRFLDNNGTVSAGSEAMRNGVASVACSADVCTRLNAAVNSSGRPYSIILANNGVTIDIRNSSGTLGQVEGYGFLMADDGYRAVVTARPKTATVNSNDGGFFGCCSDLNSYTANGAVSIGELTFTNDKTSDPTYRTWLSTTDNTTTSQRKITIVAHSDVSRLDNNKYFDSGIDETVDETTTNVYFGLAKGTIELPSSAAGHYYKVKDGIHIDQDNNEITLVNGAFNPTDFNTVTGDGPVSGSWQVLTSSTQESTERDYIYSDPSHKFGLLMTSGGNFATDGTYSTTTVIAGNDIFTQSGNYRTASVVTSDNVTEVIPKLDFYFTYNPNFATPVFGDVYFTLEEYDANNILVGNIEVKVTLSTIIEEFRDQQYDLVAMHNDFGQNEYTRKLVLPASMQRRNLYLTSVQWKPRTTPVTVGGMSYTGTGLSDNTSQFYLTGSSSTKDNTTFGLKLEPTEHISQSLTTTLGWHSIDAENVDVYQASGLTGTSAAYSGTNTDTPIAINGADLSALAELSSTEVSEYSGSRGMLMGVLDGRASAAIDLTLLFDGTITYEQPDGCRGEAVLGFDYWNGNVRQGHFDVTVYFRTRSKGDTIYLASANNISCTVGETTYSYNYNDQTVTNKGKTPALYIQSFSKAFLDNIYQAGDVFCIIGNLVISDNQSIHGQDYNSIPVVRYEGHHKEFPGRECAYRGPMITLANNGVLSVDNMVFDGSMISPYISGLNVFTTDTLKANGPIFEIQNGGTLTLGNNTTLQNNYNQCNGTIYGGAVSVVSGGVMGLANDVTIQNVLFPDSTTFNSGAVHVNGGQVVLESSKTGTAIEIAENYKISSTYDFMNESNSLVLPESKKNANVFLTRTAVAGNTLADAQSDMIAFKDEVMEGTRIGITKDFPAGRDTIRIAQVAGSKQQYAQRAYTNGNFFNDGSDGRVFYNSTISPLTIYLQRCATFQKQLYGEGSNPLDYYVLQNGSPVLIQSGSSQQPVLKYLWNSEAACPNGTDSLIYRVHGGFYPYTFQWSWGTSEDDLSTYRTYKTPYSNDQISEDLLLTTPDFARVNASNSDTAVLYGMLLDANGNGGDFYYSVTATDLAGCPLTVKAKVAMSRGQEAASLTLTNPVATTGDDEDLIHAWGDTTTATLKQAARKYRGIHLIAQVQPVANYGSVSGTLDGTEVNLSSSGTLLCPGDAIDLNTTASEGYSFMQWDFDPYDDPNTVFVMPNTSEDININAYFSPANYWKDVVTTQPTSGIDINYYGTVTISSANGLAWLISMANGLNGEQIRDFFFDTVRISSGNYNMSAHRWTPLGGYQHPFRGVLEVANDATISGIILDEPQMDHVGFFGYLDSANIDGLKLNSSIFHGSQYVGGVAAEANNSTINNSSVSDDDGDNVTVITANYASGGLVGTATNSSFENCSTAVKYMGATIYNGGILGVGQDVSATNNATWTKPRMSSLYSGGLVGSITGSTTSKSNEGSRFANNYVHFDNDLGVTLNRVGGLVGYARNTTLENNYVYGSTKSGILTGAVGSVLDRGVEVNNCYYEQGSNSATFGYNYSDGAVTGVTTFKGSGNQVMMGDDVENCNNLTLALNRWVRNHEGEGFATWRSDLEGTNHGYPRFGIPDIVPVFDSLYYETCDSLVVDGRLYTQSGTYQYHVVDSAEFVDSNITLVLTLNYSSLLQLSDTIQQGEDYDGYGFHLSATELALLLEAGEQGQQATVVVSDTLQTLSGCDSIVTLYLVLESGDSPDPSHLPDVHVYPNPTVDWVTVETQEMLSVELYDGVSRRLFSQKTGSNSCRLDLSTYATGVYYLRVRTANGIVIQKIIKK